MRPERKHLPLNPYHRSARPCSLLTIVGWLALITGQTVAAQDEAMSLERVRGEIAALRESLESDADRLGTVREQAFELEHSVAEAQARQEQHEISIDQKVARIEVLRERQREAELSLEFSRQHLFDNAAARYALSFQPKLKVLLHQDSARKLSRNLAYYDYVIGAWRGDAELRATRLARLKETESALKLETNTLRRLRHETARHLALLGEVRVEREKLVAAIEKRMNEGNTRMAQLERDESRLVTLLEGLATTIPSQAPSVPFGQLEGQLEWPTRGRVVKAPGMAFNRGGAKWAGVLIETDVGSEVRAVASGTVVFADWFRNLGKLVIIDHGDGYMTLYGNNAELLASAGEVVDAGDPLGLVGGGHGELPRGLYFELRASGEPLDPRQWCVARN